MITVDDDTVIRCDLAQFSVRDRAGILTGPVLRTTFGGVVVGVLWLLLGGG